MRSKFGKKKKFFGKESSRQRFAHSLRGFIRTIEDFTCEHCGADVKGNGYTNHCPKCLWSKHVDVHPGDRVETCGGMMEPVGLVKKKEKFAITHRCLVCGEERTVVAAVGDALEVLLH